MNDYCLQNKLTPHILENHWRTHAQEKSFACLKCPRNSVTKEIRPGISRKYMAVFWKGIMTKRTLLRKRWFELSRGFPMLFLCKVWEKFKPKKSKKKQHTDPWHGRINFIKKTSRYDYLLESSILHKILTILVCNSIFNEITILLVPNLF